MQKVVVLTFMLSVCSCMLGGLVCFAHGGPVVPNAGIENRLPAGVTIIGSDNGAWGGGSLGSTHQCDPNYQVMKIFDLSGVDVNRITEARLQVYFGLVDYSDNRNGFNEVLEVVVNGKAILFPLAQLGEVYGKQKGQLPEYRWCDFVIPVEFLSPGENRVILRKAPSTLPCDDFIYVGIDNSIRAGKSLCSLDGGRTWREDRLNTINATGEYLMRLALVERKPESTAFWNPKEEKTLDDPMGLVGYVEKVDRNVAFDLRSSRIAAFSSISVGLEGINADNARVTWYDDMGRILQRGTTIDVGRRLPARLVIEQKAASAPGADIEAVSIKFIPSLLPQEERLNLCPKVEAPEGKGVNSPPVVAVSSEEVILRNGYFSLELASRPSLQLKGIGVSYLNGRNIIRHPERSSLFWLDINGKRAEAKDFTVRGIDPLPKPASGVVIHLFHEHYSLAAALTLEINSSPEVRMGLRFSNESQKDLRIKPAFPQVGGIVLSEDEAGDYYLFPYYGGVIGDWPVQLQTAYGKGSAWWQMVDVFSPSEGAGIYVRSTDPAGNYKAIALCKSATPMQSFIYQDKFSDPLLSWNTKDELLGPGPGTAVSFGYRSCNLKPGMTFVLPEVVIGVHPGDWHEAMARYSRWAHEIWSWRPYPSRLTDIVTMAFPEALFDGKKWWDGWLSNKIDLAELQMWWDWSDVGPWRVPLDELASRLGETLVKRMPYAFRQDPATGVMQYRLNRGDYAYNPNWGGATGLREYIESIKSSGILPTFYMDGVLACDASEVGHAFGPTYGIINPLYEKIKKTYEGPFFTPLNPRDYVTQYVSWNMCVDTEWWQDYMAKTVKRICQDTGIGGIRLDELGFTGYTCHSDKHPHILAKEPGEEVFLQATSELCRKVREAMDEVDRSLILMTEFPGYDHLARFLDGTLVYDINATQPFRPVPVNLFRFYFPECKIIDYSLYSPQDPIRYHEYAFWNALGIAVGSLTRAYPDAYHRILKENADAYRGNKMEPLIPTLVNLVYANRFSTSEKELIHFYNDSGFTVNEPVMEVAADLNTHYFDLVNCKEVPVRMVGGRSVIQLKILKDKAACVARLPRRISLAREGDKVIIKIPGGSKGFSIVLTNKYGTVFSTEDAKPEGNAFQIPESGMRPSCVKLFRDGCLVDAVEI